MRFYFIACVDGMDTQPLLYTLQQQQQQQQQGLLEL